LPDTEVKRLYPKLRLRIFLMAYIGYFTYYFVRSSITLAKPWLLDHNLTGFVFNKEMLGVIGSALGVSYGLSKFFMGNVSDRCNMRYFLATGLILSGFINIIIPHFLTFSALVVLAFINGWFQGMGWPPCGRIMSHWFSDGERGVKMSIWNTAHNVGAGLLPLAVIPAGIWLFHGDWHGLFYFAGMLAVFVGVMIILLGRDTPQSVGLPPIEKYRNDYPLTEIEKGLDDREREMTGKEILFKYVLTNKWVWLLAIANVFVYCVRYGVANWAPVYLTEIQHMSKAGGMLGYALFELPAIPGTIIIGWITDKYFNGRRAPMGIICMGLVMLGVFGYWHAESAAWDLFFLSFMGFMIYGPVALIGIAAVDLVPKKAAGTSAGFTGLFGYFLGTVAAEALIGSLVQIYGWATGFKVLTGACILSMICLAFTWNAHDRRHEHARK